jgi:hypothetical protein
VKVAGREVVLDEGFVGFAAGENRRRRGQVRELGAHVCALVESIADCVLDKVLHDAPPRGVALVFELKDVGRDFLEPLP